VSALLALPTGGCLLAADALSPDLLGSLGLDPNVIKPPRGTVIVNFTNNTQLPAVFNAFETADADDLTVDTRNFSVLVDPGVQRNEVLDCPIGAVSLGQVTAEGDNVDVDAANAVIVLGADAMGTAIPYTGSALFGGSDFFCGDVISVTLTQNGAGFVLAVQVIPGR
jgi:hypothetical protein